MLVQYEPLCTVFLRHDYFQRNELIDFQLYTLPHTNHLMEKYNIIFKKEANRVVLLAEKNMKKLIKEKGRIKLNFLIYLKDNFFLNYTEGEWGPIEKKCFLFSNSLNTSLPDNTVALHKDKYVIPLDLRIFGGQKIDITKPSACISLRIDKQILDTYYVQFKAASVYWAYFFVSNYASLSEFKNLSIECSDEHILFNEPKEVVLPDKRTSLLIISAQPIQLKKQYEISFTLVSKEGELKKKIIYEKLPYPNPTSFSNVTKVLGNVKEKNTLEIFL